MPSLVTALFILATTRWVAGDVGADSVMYQKVSVVTTTRARWLVTFVMDLPKYEKAINNLEYKVNEISNKSWNLTSYFTQAGQSTWYIQGINRLRDEISVVRNTYQGLKDHFYEYNSLAYRKRNRRSLLPFMGKALHFLFGTVSDEDLSNMRQNIQTLARNQEGIKHVVSESLTIINATRLKVDENRQTLNEVITGLEKVNSKLFNVTNKIQNQISHLENYVHAYTHIDIVINEVNSMIDRTVVFFEQLLLQLNFLAVGRLTPSTITPSNLKKLLLQIQSHIKPPLRLIGDPNEDFWK